MSIFFLFSKSIQEKNILICSEKRIRIVEKSEKGESCGKEKLRKRDRDRNKGKKEHAIRLTFFLITEIYGRSLDVSSWREK